MLPFKLEQTKDLITAHAGLALLGEFTIGLGVLEALDKSLPAPGSRAGYRASEHALPLMLMLNGGGRSLEDLRQIRDDQGLRDVLELKRMPSADATGDWLRRSGVSGGLEGLGRVNRRTLKRGLKADGIKGYTLDIDATGIEAEKQTAKMTYKGYTGYMPIVGHLAENGLIVGDEFRQAFRLVVIRRPVQGDLFDGQPVSEKYTVIATNRTECIEPVVKWYNQRGRVQREPDQGVEDRLWHGADALRAVCGQRGVFSHRGCWLTMWAGCLCC